MSEKTKTPKGLAGNIASPPKYSVNSPMQPIPQNLPGKEAIDTKKAKEEFDKLKAKLEELKKKIVKKFSYTKALGLLPGASFQLFEEDERILEEYPEVAKTKPLYMIMLIPEEHYKDIPKIKPEIVKLVKESGENLWVLIKTEVDLWNYGLDSKFEFIDAIAASFPVYDSGFLGALRVANIHKSLVMRVFDKYVTSYVIAGSLVRGTADKDSDVDVFVVIDDTDVKRMSRTELLEKLRAKIYDYIREATALAGVKNILNVQVYLLTDFWQSVKDAAPVMFTFIRDGIPFYDRGTFIPWKLLLKMGKIKPSPEAIEQYMKQGEQTEEFVKRRMMDAMIDVYWGIVTPTQAMMMLVGEAPPVPKVIVSEVKKVLVEREKVMNLGDLKILEKAVKLYKDYEHGTLKEVSGDEVDTLVKELKSYTKMLVGLRKKLEKRVNEKSAEDIYTEVFKLLKIILGDKAQNTLIKDFENKIVKKGKLQPRFLRVVKELANVKTKLKAGKLDAKEADRVKKDAFELVDNLVEYAQRADLICKENGTMQIEYGNRKAELVLMGQGNNFIIEGKSVKKITTDGLVDSTRADFEKAFAEHKGKISTSVSGEVFDVLKKVLGEFRITF